MRPFVTKLGLAAALSLGLAGAATAAPATATPDGQVNLASTVPVAWAHWHGHRGWRHHGWHHRHPRHWGWHHGHHRGWHHRW